MWWQLLQLFPEPPAYAAPDSAGVMGTYFSLEERRTEEGVDNDEEEGEGSVAGLGDPEQLTIICEDFHLHKTTLIAKFAKFNW